MINATISNDEKEFQHVESLREFLLVGTAGRVFEFLNEIGVEVSIDFYFPNEKLDLTLFFFNFKENKLWTRIDKSFS